MNRTCLIPNTDAHLYNEINDIRPEDDVPLLWPAVQRRQEYCSLLRNTINLLTDRCLSLH